MADESNAEEYVFDRSYIDNTRLNLQHHLWVGMFGYLLHPDIPFMNESLRIADIGTGTGIWLSDLSRQISSTSRLDGFDISLDQAEPHAWLPDNVHLRQWDVTSDVPGDLVGQYDIVHIRLFVFVVKNNDHETILRNLMLLLKPGGWLQWGEPDIDTLRIPKTSPSISSTALEEVLRLAAASGPTMRPKWVNDLPALFEGAGLERVKSHVCHCSDKDSFGMHECNIVAYEMMLGRDKAKLLSEAVKETRAGAMFALDRVSVIGMKKGGAEV